MEKVIILSGGCGLLGKEFAKTLVEDKDNRVIVVDLYEKIKENLDRDFFNDNIVGYGIDITSEWMVQETIKVIYDNFGHINCLINCAVINPQPKEQEDNTFERYSLKRWKETLNVNLTGTFLLSRECIYYMLKNTNNGFKGTIVNVTSQLGFVSPNQNVYSGKYKKPCDYPVASAGIISLTRYLACYYGGIIKVNCLIPSMVENGQTKKFIQNVEKLIPMGRMSKKEEFNSAIKFLCSEDSSYMTGQTLVCDGGYTSW